MARTPQQVLKRMYREQKSWGKVAAELSQRAGVRVNVGFVYQVFKGKRTASNVLLSAMHLPLRPVLTPPCRKCGKAKVSNRCSHCREQKRTRVVLNDLPIADRPTALLAWQIKNRHEAQADHPPSE